MDYNIYIHSQGGGQSNPTLPWKPTDTNPTQPWKPDFQDDTEELLNPEALADEGKGLLTKGKVGVAVAAFVVATGVKVFNTAQMFYEVESGDYKTSYDIANLKNALSCITNPINKVIDFYKNQQAMRLANAKKAEELKLTGNSIINGDYSL